MTNCADLRKAVEDYVAALQRVRRHKRTMRENKCDERDNPCWVNFADQTLSLLDMCDQCMIRQTAYEFRKIAVKDVGATRRKLERAAR